MKEEFANLNEQERRKAENDYLKMKLLIETGAELGYPNGQLLPMEVENQFLKDILAFEEKYRERKQVSVFDKIGQPSHFRKVEEIGESEIQQAWEELERHLQKHSIELHTCSPNIRLHDLYRFVTEELFNHEIEDVPMAGWITTFIYDEFHPDPIYESERIIETELFPAMFQVMETSDYFHCFHRKDIRVNGKNYRTDEEFIASLNFLKSFYSKIELKEFRMDPALRENENGVLVKGNYWAIAFTADRHEPVEFSGNYAAKLSASEYGYWNIRELNIEGIDFPAGGIAINQQL